MNRDGFQQQQPSAGAGLLPTIPAMPSVSADSVYQGRPLLLLEEGLRHSIGWQAGRKAGPGFVVVRLRRVDAVHVVERFPLTEQGWEDAWRALSDLDPAAAAAVAAKLSRDDAQRRAAAAVSELDQESMCSLPRVTFNGGSGDAPLAKGTVYDLRFLEDRVIACAVLSPAALVDIPYRDVETVEISGPGRVSRPAGEVLAWSLGLAVLGGLLGLVVLGLLGLLLGAVIFGLIAATVAAAAAKTETIVRIRSADADLYFVSSEKLPDALRIELSAPLAAIDKARAAATGAANAMADRDPDSIPDQLIKLASLVQQGLLTREEFERLKAGLLAQA